MDGQELDKLLIQLDSELGDLSSIDKAIAQLERLKSLGKGAADGIKQLSNFGQAFAAFKGIELKGINETADGIDKLINVLERLGSASKYTKSLDNTKKDIEKSLDISKEISDFEREIARLDKAIEHLKKPGKSTKSVKLDFVDTDALKKNNAELLKEAKKNREIKNSISDETLAKSNNKYAKLLKEKEDRLRELNEAKEKISKSDKGERVDSIKKSVNSVYSLAEAYRKLADERLKSLGFKDKDDLAARIEKASGEEKKALENVRASYNDIIKASSEILKATTSSGLEKAGTAWKVYKEDALANLDVIEKSLENIILKSGTLTEKLGGSTKLDLVDTAALEKQVEALRELQVKTYEYNRDVARGGADYLIEQIERDNDAFRSAVAERYGIVDTFKMVQEAYVKAVNEGSTDLASKLKDSMSSLLSDLEANKQKLLGFLVSITDDFSLDVPKVNTSQIKDAYQKDIDALESALKDQEAILSRMKGLETEIRDTYSSYVAGGKQDDSLRLKLENDTAAYEKAADELEAANKRIASLTGKSFETPIKEETVSYDQYDNNTDLLNEAVKRRDEAIKKLEEARERQNQVVENTENVEDPFSSLTGSIETLEKLGKAVKNLSSFDKALKALEKLEGYDFDITSLESFIEKFDSINVDHIEGVSKALKNIVKSVNELSKLNADKVAEVVPLIDQLATAISGLGDIGSNNNVVIKISEKGAAQTQESIGRTRQTWEEFTEKMTEAVDQIDITGLFDLEAPLNRLKEELHDAERSLFHWQKEREKAEANMHRLEAQSPDMDKLRDSSRYQGYAYKLEESQKYIAQYQQMIDRLNASINSISPLRIELKGDADAMARLDHLKEEYEQYQSVLMRLNNRRDERSEGNIRLRQLRNPLEEDNEAAEGRLSEEMAIVQEYLDNIQAESIQIQQAFEGMNRSAEGLAYQANEVREAVNGISEETAKANKEMQEATQKGFSQFGSMLKGSNNEILKSAGSLFSAFGSRVGEMDNISTKLASAAGAMGKFAGAVGQIKLVVGVFKAIKAEMDKLTATISNAVKSMVEFAKTMLTKVVGAFNAVVGAVKKCVSAVQSGARIMTSAVMKLGSAIGTVAAQFGKLGRAALSASGTIGKTVLKSIPGINTMLKLSGKSLTSIVKKTALLGGLVKKLGTIINKLDSILIRRVIMAFLNELKQAFEDMAVYSSKMGTQFNENVSKIFSALRRLANQWIAAFEPLINAVTPAVLTLLEALRTVGENVAKFMALLTGQDYYLRAKPFYQDYAKDLDKANKSAKNLTNSLDELNILNKNKNSSNDEQVKPEDMWEKVPVSGSLKFPEITVRDILEKIKDFLKNIDWDAIRAKLRDWIKRLFDIINEILRDEEFWYLLGKTIAEMLNTLFAMINEAVHDLDWKALGRAIVNLIKGVLENIDWDLVRDTVKTTAEGLADTLNEIFADKKMWEEIGDAIAHYINDVIVNALDTFAWRFDFGEMADSILLALNIAMENIDWEQFRHAVIGWMQGIADIINEVFSDQRFWVNVSTTIAHLINDGLILGLNTLADNINFRQIGESIALGLNTILESIRLDEFDAAIRKWAKGITDIINGALGDPNLLVNIAIAFSNVFSSIIRALRDFVNSLEAENIGQRIGAALQAIIDSFDIISTFQLPVDAINQLAAAINGLWDRLDLSIAGEKVADALMRALENIKWDEIKSAVERSVANIVAFMNKVFANEQLWKDLGKTIGETVDTIIKVPINIMWQLDYAQIGKSLGKAVQEALDSIDFEYILGGLGHFFQGIITAFRNFAAQINWEELGREIGRGIVKMVNEIDSVELRAAIIDAFKAVTDTVSGILSEMIDGLAFENIGWKIANAIYAAILGIADFLKTNGGKIRSAMHQLADAIKRFIEEHHDEIVNALNDIIDEVCNIVREFFNDKAGLMSKIAEIIGDLNIGEILGTIIGAKINEFFEELEMNTAIFDGIVKHLGSFIKKIWEVGIEPHIGEFVAWLIGKVTGALAGAAIGALLKKALSGLIGKLAGKLVGADLGAKIGTLIGGPIGTAIGAVLGFVIGEIVTYLVEHLGEIGEVLKGFFEGLGNLIGGIIDIITGFFSKIGDFFGGIGDWIAGLFGGGDKNKEETKTEDKKSDSKTDEKIVVDAENIAALREVITNAIKDAEPILVKIEPESITALADAIKNALGGGMAAGGGMTMNSQGGDAGGYQEGQWTAEGLEKGLYDNKDNIDKWGEERAKAIIEGYSKKMEIASPSKVMERLGSWTGEGLYNGLASWIKKLVDLINQIADAIVNALKGIVDVVTGAMNLVSGALSGFGSILSGAGQGLANLGQKIGDFLSGKKESNVGDTVKKDVDDAVSYANTKLGDIKYDSISKNIAEQIKKGFEGITIPVDIDKTALKASLDEITKIINDWLEVNRSIFEPLRENFKKALLGMESDARLILGEIKNLFTNYINSIAEALGNIGKNFNLDNVKKTIEDAGKNLGEATETVVKEAEKNYGGTGDTIGGGTITKGDDNGGSSLPSELEKYLELDLLEEHAADALERLCKLAIEHVGHVKDAIWELIHEIPNELRRTFESANLEQSGVQDLFDDNPDDKLLELYAHWRFADLIVDAYNNALKAIEETTRLKCDVILSVWRQYIDKICALFEKIEKAWEAAFKKIKAVIKKRMREIYNLFRQWMKKIYDLVHSMPNYWKAAMKLDGVTNEELSKVYADFEELTEKLRKLFDKIARMWRDMMRKFPEYANRYLAATRQKFIDFVNKIKHILSGMSVDFDKEMAKFPEIADKYLDQVCKKFEEHIQHMKDLLATIAPYFAETMQKLAEVADEALEKVCDVFELHMNHIKDMIRSILEVWEYVMSKFPEIAQKYLEKTCELFTRFKECVIEKLDQILQKWISVMKQFPHIAELYLNQTVSKFDSLDGIATRFRKLINAWNDAMDDLSTEALENALSKFSDINDKFASMLRATNGLKEQWDHIVGAINDYVRIAGENGIDPGNPSDTPFHNTKTEDDLDELVQLGKEICDGHGTDVWTELRHNVVDNLKQLVDNTYAIYYLMKLLKGGKGSDTSGGASGSASGSAGGGSSVSNATGNATSSSTGGGSGLSRDAVAGAIKDAADTVADIFKDKLFPDGVPNNSGNGSGNGSGGSGSGSNGGCNCNCGDFDASDITDAVKNAADAIAQKIKDKLDPEGNISNGNFYNPPSKKDITDAIKDAADNVADKIADKLDPDRNSGNNGRRNPASKDDIADAIRDAADDVADKIADKVNPKGNKDSDDEDESASKKDIADAVKDAADKIADAVKDAVGNNGSDGGDGNNSSASQFFDEECPYGGAANLAHVCELLHQILDAILNIEIPDSESSKNKNTYEPDSPKDGSDSHDHDHDDNNNNNNNKVNLEPIIELLRQIRDKDWIHNNTSNSNSNTNVDFGNILELLRQIRDKIPTDFPKGGSGAGNNTSNTTNNNVDLSRIISLLEQIRDKIPSGAGSNGGSKNETNNYNVDLQGIKDLLVQIRDKIPTANSGSKSTNDVGNSNVNIDFDEVDKAAKRLEDAAEKIQEKLKDASDVLVNASKDIRDAIETVANQISKLSDAASNISSALNKVKTAVYELKDWIERLNGTIANLISTLKSGIKITGTCNCNCSCCHKNCAGNGDDSSSSSSASASASASSNGSGSSSSASSSNDYSSENDSASSGNASKDNDTSGNGNTSGSSGNSGDDKSKDETSSGSSSSGNNGNTNLAFGQPIAAKEGSYTRNSPEKEQADLIEALTAVLPNKYGAFEATYNDGGKDLNAITSLGNKASSKVKTLASQGQTSGSTFGVSIPTQDVANYLYGKGYNSANVGSVLHDMGFKSTYKETGKGTGFDIYTLPISKFSDLYKGMLQRVATKGYAMGGMPNSGELFLARENGIPEMVGSIGGHTAVANNDQIVLSVSSGVAQANEQVVVAVNNAADRIVTSIDNKDTSVNIGDREIAAANNRGQKQLGRNIMN